MFTPTSYAVHAPALSLPEAAMLPALPKEKQDASADASHGSLLGKDLRGVDVAVSVLHDADANLRPAAQNVRPMPL